MRFLAWSLAQRRDPIGTATFKYCCFLLYCKKL